MRKGLTSLILLLLLGTAIWWMSANVVWLGDDLDYQYRMKGAIWESWGKIRSFKEFYESQWIHYLHVNGRIVAHALVQMFNGIFGQPAFAVCNGAIYMLFAAIIAICGRVRLSENPGGVLTAIILSVLCFVTKMMPTCQIGYVWGMLFNLLWLSAFYHRGKTGWIAAAGMFVSGIIVGNWQESISLGVCAGLGIWWLSQFFDRDAHAHNFIDWQRSLAMAGYLIGTATNVLAPSTIGRVDTIDLPLTDQLLISTYSFPAILLLLLSVIIIRPRHKRGISFRFKEPDGGIPDGVFIVGTVTLIIFNCIIGIYSNRQLFGANLFAAVLLLRFLPRHRFIRYVNLIGALVVGLTWWFMYHGIKEVRRQYDDIVAIHSESSDGSVEYDRTRVMTAGHPLSAKYYEDILGQFDNDLHHSLMKDFRHKKLGKTLKLKPATNPEPEEVEKYADGHFVIKVRKPNNDQPKRRVKIYGHYSIAGLINIPADPRILEVARYNRHQPPYATTVIIPEYPFFTADSICIIP